MTYEELVSENQALRELVQQYEHQLQAIRDYIDFYDNEKGEEDVL